MKKTGDGLTLRYYNRYPILFTLILKQTTQLILIHLNLNLLHNVMLYVCKMETNMRV